MLKFSLTKSSCFFTHSYFPAENSRSQKSQLLIHKNVVHHLRKTYRIELNEVKIGTTEFEFADTPMGVIHGKINFENVESPYELFRNHCKKHNVQINDDEPKLRLIDTVVIPELKVYLENGTELNGWGGAITGMDNEEYEIQFRGITSELMQTEFKHHYDEYFGAE